MGTRTSKARTPVQERAIHTRDRILRAARALFEEKGYHGTNSKEIAARAGVAVGSFYSYFDEKKPVFLEVIRQYYREIAEKTLQEGEPVAASLKVGKKADPKKTIRELVRALYEAHTLSPSLHREITAMIYSDPEVEAVSAQEERGVRELILGVLSSVSETLAVSDLEAAARVVHRSAEEIIHRLRMFRSDIDEGRILRELEDMLYRYLFVKG
ncbi:MAG: TetR family transcriptional regulator [Spirochaetes bacterium]|nr:TetR family transcriptional regulator [Spirochaetota bacterium]